MLFNITKKLIISLGILLIGFGSSFTSADNTTSLSDTSDFQQLAEAMQEKNSPLLLVIHSEYCPHCERLVAEQLRFMTDDPRIIIRLFHNDLPDTIVDFDGQELSRADFIERYQSRLTPTLLFLDQQGNELTKRILGYTSPDFFSLYLERAIDQAKQTFVR